MVAHAQGVGDDGERRVHRPAGYEEAAIHDVEIVHVMGATVEVEDRSFRDLAEFAGADLVTQAVHRHLGGEVAGFGREIVRLRHYVATAAYFFEDAFPTFRQSVERLS